MRNYQCLVANFFVIEIVIGQVLFSARVINLSLQVFEDLGF